MDYKKINTLGLLKSAGYKPKSIKEELRENLITGLRKKEKVFQGIWGYEETVIPQVQNAILSRHDLLFRGLRGQAKTRMLRQLVHLLDDAMPIVEGSEVNDHPYAPLSKEGRDRVASQGDATPIAWAAARAMLRACSSLACTGTQVSTFVVVMTRAGPG